MLWLAVLRHLGETGYADGQNVLIEYHWLKGQYEDVKAPRKRRPASEVWSDAMGQKRL